MNSPTFFYGWASLSESRQPTSSEPCPDAPSFLIMAASRAPAESRDAAKILLYLYCVVAYIDFMRCH